MRLPRRHVGRLLRGDVRSTVSGNLVGLSGLRTLPLRHGQRLRSQLQQKQRPVRVSGKKRLSIHLKIRIRKKQFETLVRAITRASHIPHVISV